jgi:methionyl aminopeptidase
VIVYKSPDEIDKMRRAGRIVAGTIDRVLAAVHPNVTTAELDDVAETYIREQGATPSFKGYGAGSGRVPFPASICTSINQEIVHGIPSNERTVAEGDLLKLDFGAIWEGFHGDSAVTVIVGEPASAEADKLVRVTEEALEAGIAQIRPGGRLSDVGAAVEQVARGAGFEVVREYVGHGIGRNLHEDPQIPNYGAAPCSSRGWSWRSSRWSTSGAGRRACCRTAGPWSRRTGRCPRTSSTRSR